MKILILCAGNFRHMTMTSIYTMHLKKLGIDYDIIYMDKYGVVEDNEASKVYRFENIIKPNQSRLVKALLYMRFRPYATRIINKNNYSFIIVWKDTTTFMFADYLARKWKGKYCLNVRDDYHYQNRLFRIWYKPVFKNAKFVTVSSDEYGCFLPTKDFIHIHSLDQQVLGELVPRKNLRKVGEPIRIGFVGYVRFFEINKKLLSVFKNDRRFELHYYGTHANVLEEYAKENSIDNVVFSDSFPVQETAIHLENIDIMNNLYGNDSVNLVTALSIKLYHSVFMRIPILVSPNTYMEKITREIGLGFVVNEIDRDLPNRIYDWYHKQDQNNIESSCSNYINSVRTDNSRFLEYFTSVLSTLNNTLEDQ